MEPEGSLLCLQEEASCRPPQPWNESAFFHPN